VERREGLRDDYIMIGHLAHCSTTLETFLWVIIISGIFSLNWILPGYNFFFFFALRTLQGTLDMYLGDLREERNIYFFSRHFLRLLLLLKNLPHCDWIWLCGYSYVSPSCC